APCCAPFHCRAWPCWAWAGFSIRVGSLSTSSINGSRGRTAHGISACWRGVSATTWRCICISSEAAPSVLYYNKRKGGYCHGGVRKDNDHVQINGWRLRHQGLER